MRLAGSVAEPLRKTQPTLAPPPVHYPQRHDHAAEAAMSLPQWLLHRASQVLRALPEGGLRLRRQHTLVARTQALQARVDAHLQYALQPDLHPTDLHPTGLRQTDQRQTEVAALRAALARHGATPVLRERALSLVAATATQVTGRRPYPSQLQAAWALGEGHFVEMATGEGKTYAAALAAAAAALGGQPVHVLTANDYLVQRDAQAAATWCAALGLTVGCVLSPHGAAQRQAAYRCDITYGSARELAFDYLRDARAGSAFVNPLQRHADDLLRDAGTGHARTPTGAAGSPQQTLLRGLCVAIVDEADSLLVDEALMPLLLSSAPAAQPAGPASAQQRALAFQTLGLARQLREGADFVHDSASGSPRCTAAGLARLEEIATPWGGVWLNRRHRNELIHSALQALHGLQRDRDYLVSTTPAPAHIQLLDRSTGRVAQGRVWSRELQALVELKEGCPLSAPTQVVARLSLQRFFARYLHLCGMSGTLAECRQELLRVYGRSVVSVPLRLPSRRVLLPAQVFDNEHSRLQQAVQQVAQRHETGQPVLVGVDSVAQAQAMSAALQQAGIPHQRLDAAAMEAEAGADPQAHEAARVAAAGQRGAVTVATQMAGRGTDIALGAGVAALGGLHVLCCQDNTSARADRQFIGRSARAGEPGSAELWRTRGAAAWRWPARPAPAGAGLDGPPQQSAERSSWRSWFRSPGGWAASSLPPCWLSVWMQWCQKHHEHAQAQQRRQLMEQDLEWHTRTTLHTPGSSTPWG
jgi:preprotein translocase subunit SecA